MQSPLNVNNVYTADPYVRLELIISGQSCSTTAECESLFYVYFVYFSFTVAKQGLGR